MKKLIIGLAVMVSLSGCGSEDTKEQKLFKGNSSLRIYCDTKYGVEYIGSTFDYNLELRVSRDGTPVTCAMDGE